LQRKYWSSPEAKIYASVVLADEKWFDFQTRESKIYAVPKKHSKRGRGWVI
jgi:hypothetical protein